MNRKSHIIESLLTSAIFAFWGCSHTDNALRTTENTNCTTIIEGYFHAGTLYFDESPDIKGPAICVKHGSKQETHNGGKIVRRDDKGIVFLPRKESAFYGPDSVFYPYDQIVWAVDENNKVIAGK